VGHAQALEADPNKERTVVVVTKVDTIVTTDASAPQADQLEAVTHPTTVEFTGSFVGQSGTDTVGMLQKLAGMKVKALKKHAREMGLHEDALDDADDTPNPKQTVIDLIMGKERMETQPQPEPEPEFEDSSPYRSRTAFAGAA